MCFNNKTGHWWSLLAVFSTNPLKNPRRQHQVLPMEDGLFNQSPDKIGSPSCERGIAASNLKPPSICPSWWLKKYSQVCPSDLRRRLQPLFYQSPLVFQGAVCSDAFPFPHSFRRNVTGAILAPRKEDVFKNVNHRPHAWKTRPLARHLKWKNHYFSRKKRCVSSFKN